VHRVHGEGGDVDGHPLGKKGGGLDRGKVPRYGESVDRVVPWRGPGKRRRRGTGGWPGGALVTSLVFSAFQAQGTSTREE
jgi:hypothetical protein